jgi:hypothetical protein
MNGMRVLLPGAARPLRRWAHLAGMVRSPCAAEQTISEGAAYVASVHTRAVDAIAILRTAAQREGCVCAFTRGETVRDVDVRRRSES